MLTVGLRALMTPLYRRQIVSSKRMQLLGPELKEIQKRYKGDRVKAQAAQQQLYKERGISPLSGCLPILLVTLPLIPLYSVFSAGPQQLQPPGDADRRRPDDRRPALLGDADVRPGTGHVIPCLDPIAFGINWSQPLVAFYLGPIGISVLGLVAGGLMFLQSRMSLPSGDAVDQNDPNQRIQRQMGAIFPLIYIVLGGDLPAGLFLYIVISTIFSIVQQYLFTGWGGMFPLFGWQPGVRRRPHATIPDRAATARRSPDPARHVAPRRQRRQGRPVDKTIRHKERGRQGRRGRRR